MTLLNKSVTLAFAMFALAGAAAAAEACACCKDGVKMECCDDAAAAPAGGQPTPGHKH